MRAKTIVIASIVGFGFALWLARGGSPPSHAATTQAAPERTSATVGPSLARPFFAPSAPANGSAKPKLNPKSERYAKRMDDQIPTHLYNLASNCYKGNQQRDQRLDLTYHIRVRGSVISITDTKVVDSTLTDSALERCVRDTVANATWRDDDLPDLDEEGDLFMRAAGFAAYLANADDDDSAGGGAVN
jgi:hypothetical protein